MGYCTFAEVQEKVPHIDIDDYTVPTEADVENWIEQFSDGTIDSILRVKIALPVTDETGLAYLRNVTIYWIAAEIYRAVEVGSETGASFMKAALDMIKRLEKNPEMIQSPVAKIRQNRLPSSFERTKDADSKYIFRRGEKQW